MALTTLTQRQTEASGAEPVPLAALAGGPPRASSLLALDLGQRLGWALRLPDGVIASGAVDFRPSRFEGGGMIYLRFRCWLERIHAVNRVGLVVFEEVRRHVGTTASHSYGGWLAILTAWCEAERLPYEGVPIGTIKRHVTGKGNADKRAMI